MDKSVGIHTMDNVPLVSVVMPVYNAGLYLDEAIQSILDQTFTNFELLIYNDASSDASDSIIRSFSDPRIIYKKCDQNVGTANLAIEGLRIARGKYIARMDADDISIPNRFEEQVLFMEANPTIGICGTWYQNFGTLNNVVKRPTSVDEIKYALFFGTPFGQPTVMMRKNLLIKHNLEYDNMYATEDYEFFERASLYFDCANIPKVLLRYRKHNTQLTSTNWNKQYYEVGLIQARRFLRILHNHNSIDKLWLENFFTGQSIPSDKWFTEIEKYRERVIIESQHNSLYPRDLIVRAANVLFSSVYVNKNLYNYYFFKYYQQSDFNLGLLKSFLLEKYNPHIHLGRKLSFYFAIKCLMGYRKKNTASY
jgi:glycosyltransferase involved in cell wall biosynthesis